MSNEQRFHSEWCDRMNGGPECNCEKGHRLQPHQQRVVDEQKELADKLIKLREFIGASPIFQKLPMDEQARLKAQEFHMSMYWRILGDRIQEFPK